MAHSKKGLSLNLFYNNLIKKFNLTPETGNGPTGIDL
jgi:hypothetical protein